MKKKIIILFFLIPLLLSGCSMGFEKKKPKIKPDAGIWKSTDSGETWKQQVAVPTISGKPGSIGRASVLVMEMDPQDNKAIYIGTERSGIYYTYDGAITWNKMKAFPNGRVNSIQVDPKNKCVIYATYKNTVMKTSDCGRNWETVFVDNNPGVTVNAILIDFYNNNIVYISTSEGVIHKSFDYGTTWSTPFNPINVNVVKFLMSPHDSRIIYVATSKKGIYKSEDGGETWISLSDSLKDYPGYNNYRDLVFNPSRKNSLILVSAYGLLKTNDGGETWEPIPLLTAHNKADIRTVAIDPWDENIIYYATKTIFYKTINGGSDWKTKKLFSTKIPTKMLVDPKEKGVVYMSFNYPPPPKK